MSPFSTNRPRNDHHGVDLISDALPFGRLWYDGPNAASNAIGYASQQSRAHDALNSFPQLKERGRSSGLLRASSLDC